MSEEIKTSMSAKVIKKVASLIKIARHPKVKDYQGDQSNCRRKDKSMGIQMYVYKAEKCVNVLTLIMSS